MFIIRIISKDRKELNDDEIDTDDKITFDFDSNEMIINYKKLKFFLS
jgi:hypothetical protein